MEKMINENKVQLPNEDLERKMYWTVKDILEKNGYIHYEISNFSKPGYESKHNKNCWNQNEYLGFGIAAHSYFEGTRYSNICDLEEYIKNIEKGCFADNITVHEKQDLEGKMKEYMILGLRKINGVCMEEFSNRFGKNIMEVFEKQINKLLKDELIEVNEKNIKLSKKGLDLANIVWMEFV